MRTKHKFLSVLLVVVLCFTLCFALIACDSKDENVSEVKDSSKIITNGNFEVTVSDEFPKTPGSWTGSAGSTSSDNETATDDKSLIAGVIDTNDEVYKKNKSKWGLKQNPHAVGEDSNILMIDNKKPTSYKYASNSFSLSQQKYYKISFAVKTVDMEGYGAYVAITGGALVEFTNINTKGEWLEFSTVIQTSDIDSSSLSIVVSNGNFTSGDGDVNKSNKLSTGYAFFDNFKVEEIDKAKYDSAPQDKQNKKADLTLGDSEFVNISGTTTPYSAHKWSGITSVGADGESAPTGSEYLQKGIIDLDRPSEDITLPNGFKTRDNAPDSRVLMINNKNKTAYSYRTDNRIRFKASTTEVYKLSIWVYTDSEMAPDTGAYIKLKSSTDKDEEVYTTSTTKLINTDGKWEQVSIYITPDDMRYKDLYLELGLGQGGKNDKSTLVQGKVFFDGLTLEKVSANSTEAINATYKASLKTAQGTNLLDNIALNQDNYTLGDYSDNTGFEDSYYKGENLTLETNVSAENLPTPQLNKRLVMTNKSSTIQKQKFNKTITIKSNNYYRLSFWVKTDIIKESQGLSLSLYQVAEQKPGEAVVKDKKLASFDNINTTVINKDIDNYNGYTELVFLIEGDYTKDSNLYFQFELGSGNSHTPTSHVEGSAYITGISLNTVAYNDYNSESGTYVKKQSLKSEEVAISNANFNNIDMANTIKQYNKIHEKDDPAKTFDKALQDDFLGQNTNGLFGLPASWTYTSDDQLSQLTTGVYNVKNAAQSQKLNVTNVFPTKDTDSPIYTAFVKDNNNVLAIHTNEQITGKDTWGYTSPSISLSKNKYYEISVWAYATSAKASINLKSSSKSVISTIEVANDSTWTEYKFYIKTGFDDFTTYLDFSIGGEGKQGIAANQTALFDMPILTEISKEQYEVITESTPHAETFSFTTTNFDRSTASENEESLDSPNSWSGSHNDSDAPQGKDKSIGGVYNRDHSNLNLLNAGDNTINSGTIYDFMERVPGKDGQLEGESNINTLVIANHEASEYTYKTTLSSGSLKAESYYEISLWALTHNIGDGHATIRLKLHNSTYEFGKDDKLGQNVNTNDQWQHYSFYIKTGESADIDNVELSVSLGQKGKENYVKGYLFVDNVTIDEISEADFNAKAPEDKFPTPEKPDQIDKTATANTHRIVFEKADLNKAEEQEPEKEADPLLWLYITSGIIGALIIIVVLVVFARKFHWFSKLSGKKSNKGNESYNRNKVDMNKTTTSDKDINKKHQD